MRKLIAVLILCTPTLAAAQVFKCVDAGGKTVYSQSPCPKGARSEAIERRVPAAAPASPADAKGETKAGAAKAGAAKSAADIDKDFAKRRQEQQDAQKKEDQKLAEAKQKEDNCRSARGALASLESGSRQMRIKENGERYFLEDADIEQEKTRARSAVQSNCG